MKWLIQSKPPNKLLSEGFSLGLRFGELEEYSDESSEVLQEIVRCNRPMTHRELVLSLTAKDLSERSVNSQINTLRKFLKIKILRADFLLDERNQMFELARPIYFYKNKK